MIRTRVSEVWSAQWVRFLVVAGLNTGFGYGLFALLIFFGLHYAVAAFFSTIAGILFNFLTIGNIVFRRSELRLMFRFLAVYGIVYGLNVAGLKGFLWIGVDNYVGGALLILPMGILSFALNKWFVFERRLKPAKGQHEQA